MAIEYSDATVMGYIGGVTLLAMLLSYRGGFKPTVMLLWVLFVAVALFHAGHLGLPL